MSAASSRDHLTTDAAERAWSVGAAGIRVSEVEVGVGVKCCLSVTTHYRMGHGAPQGEVKRASSSRMLHIPSGLPGGTCISGAVR